MSTRIPLDGLLATGGGVIAARHYPQHRRSLYRLVADGELVAVLPGVLAPAGQQDRADIRIRAMAAWVDDAVLTGWAAAALTFWPEIAIPAITASVPRYRSAPRGFVVTQEVLPRQLIRTVRGIRVTAPELTALDLAVTDGGDAIARVAIEVDGYEVHRTERQDQFHRDRRKWTDPAPQRPVPLPI